MRLRVRVLAAGTRVRVRHPGTGERGTWRVVGRVVGSGLADPAYDVRHERTGRPRVFRRSHLRLVRSAAGERG
ncbi:MAG TPA: hypothetical protein VFA45_22935 [Actinomycetes bacterium]|jgi:hypothetical protein|nr:hypothetical protein [Actinomycetes bacterium]